MDEFALTLVFFLIKRSSKSIEFETESFLCF